MSHPLIEHLRDLRRRDDRAALAALRRGLAGEANARVGMHPHVLPFFPQGTRRWQEECAYATASLFAFHGGSESAGASIGAALRRIAPAGGDKETAVEARFVALLESHADDLVVHLRHVVSLLKSGEIPLDWDLLLQQLSHWDHPEGWVQRRWARDFWARAEARAAEADATTEGEENNQ